MLRQENAASGQSRLDIGHVNCKNWATKLAPASGVLFSQWSARGLEGVDGMLLLKKVQHPDGRHMPSPEPKADMTP